MLDRKTLADLRSVFVTVALSSFATSNALAQPASRNMIPTPPAIDMVVDRMAFELARGAGIAAREGVAVLPLPHDTDVCSGLSVMMAELLINALVNTPNGAVRVIERRRLQQLILDNRLQDQLNDPESQRRLSGLASVRFLATGTILPSAQQVRVTVRLVDLQTGAVLASTRGDIPTVEVADDIRRVVGRGSGCELGGSPTTVGANGGLGPRPAPSGEPVLAEVERGGLRMAMLSAAMGPRDGLNLTFSLRNTTTSAVQFHLVADDVDTQIAGERDLPGSNASGIPQCQGQRCMQRVVAGEAEFTEIGPGDEMRIALRIPGRRHRFASRVSEITSLTIPIVVRAVAQAGSRPPPARRVDLNFGRTVLP